ncbi:hypothetical protein Nepgr_026981 [Nepenthes gracilis]|uniref:Uncharacterized protein n=1 Tax=Nepenthes gracilis TaxID=150966 RepID=A0AAD3Y130_NEPGR|nr:hypothetical protein Nepgr_026981 [Nepenthes gracilis]
MLLILRAHSDLVIARGDVREPIGVLDFSNESSIQQFLYFLPDDNQFFYRVIFPLLPDGLSVRIEAQFVDHYPSRNSKHVSESPCEDVSVSLQERDQLIAQCTNE